MFIDEQLKLLKDKKKQLTNFTDAVNIELNYSQINDMIIFYELLQRYDNVCSNLIDERVSLMKELKNKNK